jgi:hypothetical protein
MLKRANTRPTPREHVLLKRQRNIIPNREKVAALVYESRARCASHGSGQSWWSNSSLGEKQQPCAMCTNVLVCARSGYRRRDRGGCEFQLPTCEQNIMGAQRLKQTWDVAA